MPRRAAADRRRRSSLGAALIVAREAFGWDSAVLDDWLLFILFALAGGFCAWRAAVCARSAARGC